MESSCTRIQNHKLILETSSVALKENPGTEIWASAGYKLQTGMMTTCMNLMSSSAEPNFQVDDLLDFPNEDDDLELVGSPFVPHAEALPLLFTQPHSPICSSTESKSQQNFAAADLNDEEPPTYGLCVPPDELVHQLEWLSAFNEDNFFAGGDTKLLSSFPTSSRASSDLTMCAEAPRIACTARDNFHRQSPISVLEQESHLHANACALKHVFKAHRVRKARTGGRVWSVDILKPILLENRLKSSCENSSLLLTSCSSAYSETLWSFLQHNDSERPYKKMKQVAANNTDSAVIQKCTHCLVQKTPQWRAGPLGPKTLCNACGVRYKSGRLVPEYRPVASPSFVNEVHSNSHRRILEMRRAKEGESHAEETTRTRW